MSYEWAEPRPYIRVDSPTRVSCGNCGRKPLSIDATSCGPSDFIADSESVGCGVAFTQITSPFEEHRDFCERQRPDLEYKVLRWC